MTERKSELICRVKYCNNLPDIPFDPKFITYPFDSSRFIQYKPTSLENNYKHDLLTEHDLGVEIDLINPQTYHVSPEMHIVLEPEDEKLLEEEPVLPQNTKRSINHHKAVPWLKKTEYISTEFNRYGASSEKNETKVGYKMKKDMKDDNLYLDRDSQITAIDKTFEEAKKEITEHHNKKGVTPVEILPVLPDFKLWKYPFAQVQFDSDPAQSNQIEEMSQAMIRGVMDHTGEQFVAYFLPTQETLDKRKIDQLEGREYLDDLEYEYKMAREYNWNVKSKASKNYEENYFFVFRDDCMVYNELETRVRLTKRRKLGNQSTQTNSRLIVRHRELNDQELKQQEIRLKSLQPPQDDEDEDDEQMDGEPQIADTTEKEDQEIAAAAANESDKDSDKSDDSDKESIKEKQSPVKNSNNKNLSKAIISSSSSSSDDSSNDDKSDKEDNKSSSSSSESDSDSD